MNSEQVQQQVREALVANYVETGQTAFRNGHDGLARTMLFRAARQASALPPDSKKKAMVLANLAGLCVERKRYRAAEQLYQAAYTACDMSQESECKRTAAVLLSLLADLYAHRSRYVKASKLYRQVFDRFERIDGIDHGKVSTVCDRLAEIFRLSCKYAQAEKWSRRAVSFHQSCRKSNCSMYAVHLKRLGLIYCHQERYDRAGRIFDSTAKPKRTS